MKKVLIIFWVLAILFTTFSPLSADEIKDENLLVNDDRIFALANKYSSVLTSLYWEDAARLGINVYDYEVNIKDAENETSKIKALDFLTQYVKDIRPDSLSTYAQADYYTLKELVNLKYFYAEKRKQFELDPMWYLQSLDTVYEIAFKDSLTYQQRFDYILKIIETMPKTLKIAEKNLVKPSNLNSKLAIEKINLELANIQGLTNLILKVSDDAKSAKNQVNTLMQPLEKALSKYRVFLQNKLKNKEFVDFRIGSENYKYLFQDVYTLPYSYKKLKGILEKNLTQAQENLIAVITPRVLLSLNDEQKEQRTIKGKVKVLPEDYYLIANQYKKAPDHKKVLQEYSNQIKKADSFFVNNRIFPSFSLPVNLATAPVTFKNKPYPITIYPPMPLIEKKVGDIFITLPQKTNLNNEVYNLNYGYAKIKLNSTEFITPGKMLIYSVEPVNISLANSLSDDMFYINGWAKYALDTAYENNFFTSEEEKLNYIWFNYKKAVYAMVDYKLQTEELNLDSAFAYVNNAGIKENEAKAYLNYLATKPLDAVAYILGSQEFHRLKTKYKKQLGKDFNLLTFHTKVLSVGRIPLISLEKTLEKAYSKKDVNSYFSMEYF